jgi:hypothetical protein
MSKLEEWESRLERALNRLFMRGGSPLQQIEITEAVRNALNSAAKPVSESTVLIPHRYVVQVSANDFERLSETTQMSEVGAQISAHIAKQGYKLGEPLQLELHIDRGLRLGEINVEADETPEGVLWQPVLLLGKKRHELRQGATTIGRSKGGADITIADSGLSRVHFEIAWNGKAAAIRDHQSTNGTYLNGARIGEAVLRSGDVILAGRIEMTFELVAKAVA